MGGQIPIDFSKTGHKAENLGQTPSVDSNFFLTAVLDRASAQGLGFGSIE
jgi:hypothetical protein